METTFDRFYPTHPGEVLKDELEERGISQRKFAESIGMGYSVLNEILNGKRPITTTSALMFEAALDIPADSLLKLQINTICIQPGKIMLWLKSSSRFAKLQLYYKYIFNMAIIKTVEGKTPQWGKNCFIAENAVLTGDCILGDDCSIWYSAVLRSDVDAIRCGNRVNVQDCACIHQTGTMPCILEDDVSVGHGAIVHGATVRKGALIGMNATVLDKADIGEGAIIAAGAVVTHGTKVPAHEIWAGIPARKVKVCAPGQAEEFAKHYSGYIKDWYLKEDK